MATSWFNEEYYLQSKLAQLRATDPSNPAAVSVAALQVALQEAGFTPQSHFEAFGAQELTSPNPFFNATEYLEAKVRQLNSSEDEPRNDWTLDDVVAAIQGAGMTPWTHYQQFGWKEGVNPSNSFDLNAYFESKLALLQRDDPEGGWTLDSVKAAFAEVGVDPVTHYALVGETEGVEVAEVPSEEQVPSDGRELGDTYTLQEALAVEELPDYYRISDTTLTLEAGTIESIGEQIDAAQAIVDGAQNADELELDADYTIEDSVEAVLAAAEAGNTLVEDVSRITFTDETITLSQRESLLELGFETENLPPLEEGALVEALANLETALAARDAFVDENGDVAAELEAAQAALSDHLALGTDGQLNARVTVAQADLEAAQGAAVDVSSEDAELVRAQVSAQAALAEAVEAVAAAQEVADAAATEVDAAQGDLDAARAERDTARTEVFEAREARVEAEMALIDAERVSASVESELEEAQIAFNTAQADVATAETAEEQAQADLQVADQELATAQTGLVTADAEVVAAQEALGVAQGSVDTAETDLAGAVTARNNAQTALEDAEAEVVAAQSARDTAQETFDSATATRDTAQETFDAAETAVDEAEIEVGAALSERDTAQTAVDSATTTRDNAQTEVTTATEGVTTAEAALATAETTRGIAQTARDTAQETLTDAEDALADANSELVMFFAEGGAAAEFEGAGELRTEQDDVAALVVAFQAATPEEQATFFDPGGLGEGYADIEELEARDADLTDLTGQLDALEATRNEAVTTAEDAQAAFDTADQDLTEAEEAVTAAQGEVETAEGILEVAEAALLDAQGLLTTAEGELDAAEGRLDTAQEALTEAEAARATAGADLGDAEDALELAADALAAAEGDLETATAARATAQGELDTAVANVETAQDALDTATATRDTAQAALTTAEENRVAAQTAVDTATTNQATAQTALTDAQAALGAAELVLTDADDALAAAQEAFDNAGPNLTEAQEAFDAAVAAEMAARDTLTEAETAVTGAETAFEEATAVQATAQEALATEQENQAEAQAALDEASDAVAEAEISDEDFALVEAVVDAEMALADAEGLVQERMELRENVADAQVLAEALDELDADVEAAEQVLEDMGYGTPQVVEGDPEVATEANDIFVLSGEDGTITNFSAGDLLYVSEDFTLFELEAGLDLNGAGTAGSITDREIFVQQDGEDTLLWIEAETFSGNDKTGEFDGNVVRLEGVDAAQVTIELTGFIGVNEGAPAVA